MTDGWTEITAYQDSFTHISLAVSEIDVVNVSFNVGENVPNSVFSVNNLYATDPSNISINLIFTEYGATTGEFIKGNFSGDFIDNSGGSHTITGGYFQVRR